MIDKSRTRLLQEGKRKKGPVLYWMSRDQRADDNWALLYSQERAIDMKVPLIVCFNITPSFLDSPYRAYDFMLKGMEETEKKLLAKRIPFFLLEGEPEQNISILVSRYSVSEIITDFDPLRIKKQWKRKVGDTIDIPLHEVDSHNIIPCWETSTKKEFAARTIRPKIHRLLNKYLVSFPDLLFHPFPLEKKIPRVAWKEIQRRIRADRSVPPVSWLVPGSEGGMKVLEKFISERLERYPLDRNDPGIPGLSLLSPYLHFGHISPQRTALEVSLSRKRTEAKEAFLEEVIVRRELADNFCFYTPFYDSYSSFPEWARNSLNEHRQDRREHLYSFSELEGAETHDELWNAGQLEMVMKGKMHGWIRMYWAKKILEWSPSPEEALQRAILLNDRYELDGRDPNGYTGIAWSIGGVHDRAWPSRPVFGKIRYMNYKGATRKFNVQRYIEQIKAMAER